MKIRRIVTGCSPDGKAVVLSDGPSPWAVDAAHVPGLRTQLLWQTTDPPVLASRTANTPDPVLAATTFLARAGTTSIQVVTLPPDASVAVLTAEPADIGRDFAMAFPGLAELFETENPGMHATDTLDYCIVLEGEVVMELDDGALATVRRNDVVVQNGTRHGWRNRTDKPATIVFVMIGATRPPR
jgi:mannose-6-phosphate isomerase-like protein (cupin superfamily)